TSRTLLAGAGFVDCQAPSLKILAVEGVDRRLSAIVHLDKPEAAAAPRLPVHDHLRRLDVAVLREQIAQIVGRRAERKVTDIQILAHVHSPASPKALSKTRQKQIGPEDAGWFKAANRLGHAVGLFQAQPYGSL